MSRATNTPRWAILLFMVSCGAGDKERAKLAEVQRQADERIAQVEADAKEKVASAEKRTELLQSNLAEAAAQAKAAAADEVASAKSEAEKYAAQATAALGKARAAYKESEKMQLAALVKEADELHSKAVKAPSPKTKAQIDLSFKAVTAKRDEVRKQIAAFDTATLDSIRGIKAKVDKAMAELKHAVHGLRAKVS